MSALVAVLLLVAWQSSVEVLKRRGPALPPELLRKLVHVGSGLIVASLPFFLPFRTIAALAVAFVAAMAFSRRLRVLTAVHDSNRRTYGEIFYPTGIGLLAATHPSRQQFVYAALVLALADGLAAVIGSCSGRGRLPWGKSIPGTTTFFLISSTIGISVLTLVGVPPETAITTALVAAAILTVVETALRGGLDNLVLPPLAGVVIGMRIDALPLLQAAWLIAPVVLAGFVHSIVIHRNLAPRLARPLDGRRTIRGRRLFGSNKTWRGVIVMSTMSGVGALALDELSPRSLELPLQTDSWRGFLLLGFTLGLAYSLAELPNSFVKRQLGVVPGGRARNRRAMQFLFDQLDSVVGVVAVLSIFVREPVVLVAALLLGFAVHVVADRLLYAFHVKPSPRETVSTTTAEALA
jgi:CDP-2,3-bis-(O-geranylgeranyl)-sn-glycerol synthase